MNLGITERVRPLIAAVRAMVRDEIMPIEEEYEAEVGREGDRFKPTARMVEISAALKARARSQGLWNFWLTGSDKGHGLTTVEYAYLAEEMGWSPLAAEAFNCSAPDTGNMEVLERFGSPEQKARWLPDLLDGKTAFGLSDDGAGRRLLGRHQYRDVGAARGRRMGARRRKMVVVGRRRSALLALYRDGLTDPGAAKHARHSMLLVPAETKGIEKLRAMKVYGADDAAARPSAHKIYPMCACRARRSFWGAGAASRSRKGGSGPAASIIACARSARPSGLWRRCAGARAGARGFRAKAHFAGRQSRHYRGSADVDRNGAAAVSESGLGDGHARRARRRAADLADQGDRARASRSK